MTRVSTSRRTRDERGAAMLLGALMFAFLALPLCAIGVDTARWWVEAQRLQAAADAASTAGVTFMPDDFAQAEARALEVAKINGYEPGSGTTITVGAGDKPTQLKVTITRTVNNFFAESFGVGTATLARGAVADFNGPAPMGSPCNTFGNEPNGSVYQGPTTTTIKAPPLADCPAEPEYWGSISGPEVAKDQGSQFEARKCIGIEDGCTSGKNDEFDARGFIYLVRVAPAAVGQSIELQIYDPATIPGRFDCTRAPTSNIGSNTPNSRVTDGLARYQRAASSFCTGDDASAASRFGSETPTITSFGLRRPVHTLNPFEGTPEPGCAKQFGGVAEGFVIRDRLRSSTGSYNDSVAQLFHQWAPLCTFTPSQAGDYYLQVRTNVPFGSANSVYTQNGDNDTVKGNSINSFALRAISGAPAGAISFAAHEKMRIFANADSATTEFNLVRVVPSAANKSLVVSFFDVGEGATNGTVRLIPPADSNLASVDDCTAAGVEDGDLTNCEITNISSTNYNGKLQTIRVPIPNDYTCTVTSNGGCWWRVEVSFGVGEVRDATTWTAKIEGEPVRLIE